MKVCHIYIILFSSKAAYVNKNVLWCAIKFPILFAFFHYWRLLCAVVLLKGIENKCYNNEKRFCTESLWNSINLTVFHTLLSLTLACSMYILYIQNFQQCLIPLYLQFYANYIGLFLNVNNKINRNNCLLFSLRYKAGIAPFSYCAA